MMGCTTALGEKTPAPARAPHKGHTYELVSNDMFDAALRNTRIEMSPSERKQFFERHIKHMTLQVDESGNVRLELKRG